MLPHLSQHHVTLVPQVRSSLRMFCLYNNFMIAQQLHTFIPIYSVLQLTQLADYF